MSDAVYYARRYPLGVIGAVIHIATAWVLGSLPFFVFGMIWLVAPKHLEPLFNTGAGNFILGLTLAMIATGLLIIRQIIKVDI